MSKNSVRAIAALGVAALVLAAGPARADVIETYDFSGTLAYPPYAGAGDEVTGQFTLDITSAAITTFNFATPARNFTPATATAHIFQYTPAVNPAKDFVALVFAGTDESFVELIFQTNLSSFSGSSFYLDGVHVTDGVTISVLSVEPPFTFISPFSSGAATPAVPEPSTWALMLAGFAGLGFLGYRRNRDAPLAA